MNNDQDIREIERIISSLEYHFQKYIDYKYDSKSAPRKRDRDRAFDNMIAHVEYIKKELCDPLVFNIISDGNQFQFEDFWKYVQSDVPDYLRKIISSLEKLKSERN